MPVETLLSRLLALHQSHPERTAIIMQQAGQPDDPLSYDRLLHNATGIAALLTAHAISPGEVVILVLQHGPALINSFYGALLHGAVPSIMPFLTEKLSPEKYQADIATLLGITRPAAILTEPAFLPLMQQVAGPNTSVRAVLDVSACPSPPSPPHFTIFTGLGRSPEDIVLLQHSSGTTGLQKGVALSNRAVIRQLDTYAAELRLSEQDVIVSWLPLYHDMGLIAGFILPVLKGVPLVLMSPFDWVRAPYKLLQAISAYHGTLTWLPNFAYNFCAQKIRDRDLTGVDLSSLRAVSNCSEPMRWDSHQLFYQRFQPWGLRFEALTTCYAMAENVFAVSQGGIHRPISTFAVDSVDLIAHRKLSPPSSPDQTATLLSAGPPIANTNVRILSDRHQPLPEDEIGEIALQSDCMLTGYYNRPDVTHQAFHRGWLLTGDLGFLHHGEVYVIGRKKDLIIVGGKNIFPQDLENLAYTVKGIHPGRAVAFGLMNDSLGTEEVVIVAECEPGLDDPRILEDLEAKIRLALIQGSEITPRQVKVVPSPWILKTSSGKTARSANRDKYLRLFGPDSTG
ncbi:MAG: AMP-binding protein [Anaerolineales bacterium]|nr:AMP-binding protein [Anaerolineales bacterium]